MFTWIRYNIKGDRWIWSIAVILSIISLLSVYSATSLLAFLNKGGNTEYYLFKHFLLIILSIHLFHLINLVSKLFVWEI